jgi:hypothetical protein
MNGWQFAHEHFDAIWGAGSVVLSFVLVWWWSR